jgi:hypothetical protein
MLVPTNNQVLSPGNFFTQIWRAILLCIPLFAAVRLATSRATASAYAFLIGWFVIALLPILRMLTLTDALEGSRMGYFASAPICILIALTLLHAITANKRWNNLALAGGITMLTGLVTCGTIMLLRNNHAWVSAGECTNSLRSGFAQIFSRESGVGPYFIFGIPNTVNGAVVSRNALGGLTGFTSQSIYDPEIECLVPLGFTKAEIAKNAGKARIYEWSTTAEKFIQITDLNVQPAKPAAWSAVQLKELLRAPRTGRWTAAGLEIETSNPIYMNLHDLPCWATDVIVVHCKALGSHAKRHRMELSFSSGTTTRQKIQAVATDSDGGLQFAFNMRQDPYWLFGGTAQNLTLTLLDAPRMAITGLEIVPATNAMPLVKIHGETFDSAGVVQTLPAKIEIDASHIAKATGCSIQICKAWKGFDREDQLSRSNIIRRIPNIALTGTFTLTKDLFPASGNYAVRAVAIDGDAHQVGVPGDHFVVHVD